jgi:fucose 4-O-acetylase-like acetyltransferase
MADNRIHYMDAVGAVMLIYMILGHCFQLSHVTDYHIYLTKLLDIFMPWFFFKAGMFYKNRPFREELKKSSKRLLIPFVVFSIIGSLVWWLQMYAHYSMKWAFVYRIPFYILWRGALPGNLPLWFLLSLFGVKILFNYANHLKRGKWLVVSLVSVVWILVGRLSAIYGLPYPLWLSNISSGLMFFTIGYLLRNYTPSRLQLIVITLAYLLLVYFHFEYMDMRTGIMGKPLWTYVPQMILGIIAINGIGLWMGNFPSILSRIGEDSMAYYCLHWIVAQGVRVFYYPIKESDDFILLMIMVTAEFVCLPLFTKWIKHSKYQKIV